MNTKGDTTNRSKNEGQGYINEQRSVGVEDGNIVGKPRKMEDLQVTIDIQDL